jgi:predicted RNA-binding Zn ribbon-like protein
VNESIDFPILGEPFLVEFINTLYVDGNCVVDFLAEVDRAEGWLAAMRVHLGARIVLDEADTAALRRLRDAIRLLTTTPRSASRLGRAAVGEINRAAASLPRTPQLAWNRNELVIQPLPQPCSVEALLATLAADAVDVITGSVPGAIVLCGRPGCNMRYFRDHHRRRYCNVRCASADRQSRYYRRITAAS